VTHSAANRNRGPATHPLVEQIGRSVALVAGLAVGACAGAGPSSTTTAASVGGDDDDDEPKGASTADTDPIEDTGDIGEGDESSGTESDTGGSESDDGSDTAQVTPCPTELESFATDPGWVAKNLPDGKNDYAWSPGTANAGGGAGEIGGRFQRSTHRSSLAHVIPAKDSTSCIYASGRIAIPRIDDDFRSRVSFGHFDGLEGAHVGFDVANEDGGGVRVILMAGGLSELAFILDAPEVARTWTYAWDPMLSTMTLTIDGIGTITRALAPSQSAAMQGLDRFGIRHQDHDTADNNPGVMKVYLDEIDYTR
jgi:hypothetical protein